jgi:hypothetical protein
LTLFALNDASITKFLKSPKDTQKGRTILTIAQKFFRVKEIEQSVEKTF